MTKRERLAELAHKRKADFLPGHHRLGDFHGGAYDQHEHVSPWTISAHNLDADLMIILQDWCSGEFLSGPLIEDAVRLGCDPHLATNKNLIALVQRHFSMDIADAYVTNLFVFIKPGGMSAHLAMADAVYSARTYAVPQIEIVQPKTVLCVGKRTFDALRRAMGLGRSSSPMTIAGASVYGVPHTGKLGTANAGGIVNVDRIWSDIASKSKTRRQD